MTGSGSFSNEGNGMSTLFEQAIARVTHLEIELRRATLVLKAFVDWHDMDPESPEVACHGQTSYDRAIEAARNFVEEQRRQCRMAEEGVTEDVLTIDPEAYM